MFEDALRYPWNGDDNVARIGIGGGLTILGSMFLLPIFVVYGYLVRVIREVSAGNVAEPPAFEDWEAMFVDGLKAFVVMFAYTLVPTIVLSVSMFAFVLPVLLGVGADSAAAGLFGFLVALLVVLVAAVVSLVAFYLLPAALVAFARTGRIGAAFSPSGLRAIGGSKAYLVAVLVAFGVLVVLNFVSSLVSVTVVGLVLIPFLGFYGNVGAAYAIAEGTADVHLE